MRNHILTLVTLISIFGTLGSQDKLSSNTLASIGRLKANTGEVPFNAVQSDQVYVKTQFNFGGIAELIDANTKSIDGISSTEDGVLDRAHAVTGIQIAYATSDATSGAAAISPGLASYTVAPPAALLNSIFRIKQGDNTVFECILGDLINGGDTNLNERFTEVYPIGLGNKQKLRMEVKFPDGATQPANLHTYLSVNLRTQSLSA